MSMHELNRTTNHSEHGKHAHLTNFHPCSLFPGAKVLLVSLSDLAISASVISWKGRYRRGSGSSGKACSTSGGLALKKRACRAAVMFALSLNSPSSVDRAGMVHWCQPCHHHAALQSDSMVALCSNPFAQTFLASHMVEHSVFCATFFSLLEAMFLTSWTACWHLSFHHRAPLGLNSLCCSKVAIKVSLI